MVQHVTMGQVRRSHDHHVEFHVTLDAACHIVWCDLVTSGSWTWGI